MRQTGENQMHLIDVNEFSDRGEAVYQKIRRKLEKKRYIGKIVAIDVETGEYFVGDTEIKAGEKGRKKYSGKVFYFVRIGYPAVHVRH